MYVQDRLFMISSMVILYTIDKLLPIQGANTYDLICNKCLHQAFVEVQYHVNVICINKCLAYPSKIYDIGYGGQNMYANVKTISIFSVFVPLPFKQVQIFTVPQVRHLT